MAGLKEIRRRITSVKNTRQITRAMKLVSAAKLKKAQEAAYAGRQFSAEMKRALLLAMENLPEDFTHPYLKVRAEGSKQASKTTPAKRRVIVVGGERGLSGAFNANLLKAVQQQENTAECEFVLIGKKACSNGRRFFWKPAPSITANDPSAIGYEGLSEDILSWPVEEIIKSAISGFAEGDVEEVIIYYTKFVSALTQKPTREILLPLDAVTLKEEAENAGLENLVAKLEPSAKAVFEYITPIYLRSKLREAGLESRASEHSARMTAMESATNNASDLIDRLKLFYNRARQSAITTELIDIIGGAGAVD